MLTKLCCDKWFISTTLNLKACHISSFCSLTYVQIFTVPSACALSAPRSLAHSVFVAFAIIFIQFRTRIRIIRSFQLIWASVLYLVVVHTKERLSFCKMSDVNVSLCRDLLASEISFQPHVVSGACAAAFPCNEGGLTCQVMFNLNRCDVRDYRCLLYTSHTISEIFD